MIENFSIREILEAFREGGIWPSFPGDSRMIREESHVCHVSFIADLRDLFCCFIIRILV